MFKAFFKLLFLAILVAGAWLAWGLLSPARPADTKFVMLRPGWSTRHIANELQSQGIIHDARAFLAYHYLAGPKTIKAGEYKFDHASNALEIHDRLVRGDIFVHYVTVPEGFNMFDVAGAIEAAGLGTRAEFLQLARSQVSLIADLDPQATSLEGYLFPDTYAFTRTQNLAEMTAAMVKRFHQEAKTVGLSGDVHRIVTLASIVEKETAAADERGEVASVYQNRLDRNMALDADPSVIYAALLDGHFDGSIHVSDLQSESPYNTYKHAGLPPGPIANPGHASLVAAMQPAKSEFLYFVADGTGHHRFSSTLEEHSRNVAAYRRTQSASHQ